MVPILLFDELFAPIRVLLNLYSAAVEKALLDLMSNTEPRIEQNYECITKMRYIGICLAHDEMEK